MKEIYNLLKTEEAIKMDQELKINKKYKKDFNEYYQAIRKVNAREHKNPLQIYDVKFNLTTLEKDRVNIIPKFFQKLFLLKHTGFNNTRKNGSSIYN